MEQEVHFRKAQQRKAEADEERLKAEEEEGIEVGDLKVDVVNLD